MAEASDGRDRNYKAFIMQMVGVGVRGGFAHGLTGDYVCEAADNRMPVHRAV